MSEVCQRADVWGQSGEVDQVSNEGKGQRGQTYLKVWCGQMYLGWLC